ncbi:MAG: ATP-binding protein [Acidobacteriaceae bacterium]|nr:ATP-binding protein [Acidobacteriaceae bacterium]
MDSNNKPLSVARWHSFRLIAVSLTLILLIAFVDSHINSQIPLGFLYLLPMLILGRGLGYRIPLICVGIGCTILAEINDEFPVTVIDGTSRLLVYLTAFLTTGFHAQTVQRNKLLTLLHIHEIETQRDALDDTERQLEALIETSPAAILTTDITGQILTCNEAARQLLGFSTQPGALPPRIHNYLPALSRFLQHPEIDPKPYAMIQSHGIRSNGQSFLADISFSIYGTKAGARLTAIVFDTSEGFRRQEEASLRQVMSGTRLVASAISHEIRNISTAIAVVHHNLKRTNLLDQNKDFEAMGGLVEALESVVDMDLEGGTAPSELEITPVLEELQIVITPLLQQAGIAYEGLWEASLPKALGERSQLMQILLNLVNNSLRALAHVEQPRLRLTATHHHGSLYIAVEDNGGGVPHPARLFRPFQTGAHHHGLGLYLSRAFARSSGGNLIYQPIENGARFLLSLPEAPSKEPLL